MDGEKTRNNKKERSKKTKKTFKLVFDNDEEIYRHDVVRDLDKNLRYYSRFKLIKYICIQKTRTKQNINI